MQTTLLKKLRNKAKETYRLEIQYPKYLVVSYYNRKREIIFVTKNIKRAIDVRNIYRRAFTINGVTEIRIRKNKF